MDQPQQPHSTHDMPAAANSASSDTASTQNVPAVPPTPIREEQEARQPDSDMVDELTVRAKEAAEKLKPVAVAAEEIAGQAINLSIKGLNQLSAYLQRRHDERESEHHTPPPPKSEG